MSFYGLMQLGVPQLKGLLRRAGGVERRRYLLALLARDGLCVAFAAAFLSALNALFGAENSCAGVVCFCLLLGCRFVHFNYRLRDTAAGLAAAFALLTLGPPLAHLGPPLFRLAVNLACMGALLLLTADQPRMGNGLLYLFSYLLLYGSPAEGAVLALRCGEMAVGFALCAGVVWLRHRHSLPDRGLRDVVRALSLGEARCRWQLRTALGVSLAVFLGELLGLPRVMWVGFAASSVLSAYGAPPRARAAGRVTGALAGCALFVLVYTLCPASLRGGLGILSGLCLGLCASYRGTTAFNCLGALLTAAPLYGPGGAMVLRLCSNLLGALFGALFALGWERLLPVGGAAPEAAEG